MVLVQGVVQIRLGLSHLKACLRLRDLLPQWVTTYPLAGVSHHMDLSMGLLECPHNMAPDLPQSKPSERAKEKLQ